MALIKKGKIKTVIICLLVFILWAGLSLYRTLNINKDWFENKEEIAPEAQPEIKHYENITDRNEFNYATAWCKSGENWLLINIDGYAEIVLDKNYVEVTDFGNTGYAIVKDSYGNKAVIDRTGTSVLYDNCYLCDEIVSDNFNANMIIAKKTVVENGVEKEGYGIIDATLNWAKQPSSENEYLKEFTKGIDGGVFTNEAEDKLYFYTIDTVIEDVDQFLYCDTETVMFRKGDEICLIDKSGEHLRLDYKGVAKVGEWAEHTIFCEFTDGRKELVDINGKCVLDLTPYNIVNSPRMINGYVGILMQTEEGTKYTVIDEKGNFVFEPRFGTECEALTEKVFKVKFYDEEREKEVIQIINEKGEKLFEVQDSITYFNNGYAIKDNEIYVRTDGTPLNIYGNEVK